MNKKIFFCITILLFSFNLTFGQIAGKIIKGKGFEGVILEMSVKILDEHIDSAKKWIPTENDIREMEDLIPPYFKIKSTKGKEKIYYHEVFKDLNEYRKQYMGYFTPTGEKMIYISAFLYDKDPKSGFSFNNWTKQYVYFFDGGTSAWRLTFNVSKKSFSNFNINGSA